MEVNSVFITGANRGIGLEFVRQIVNLPDPPKFIFATYRNRDASQELKKLRDETERTQIHMINMDVTNLDQIKAARKIAEDIVGDMGITLLINNAGAAQSIPFPDITDENLLFHFKTNAMGPVLVLQEFLPLLEKAAEYNKGKEMGVSRSAVLTISSLAGSISHAGLSSPMRIPVLSYRMSKAALNMAVKEIAADVKDKGILLLSMCPGWVKTDMGGERAQIEPQDSISSMLKTLPTLDESHHGLFLSRNGDIYEF